MLQKAATTRCACEAQVEFRGGMPRIARSVPNRSRAGNCDFIAHNILAQSRPRAAYGRVLAPGGDSDLAKMRMEERPVFSPAGAPGQIYMRPLKANGALYARPATAHLSAGHGQRPSSQDSSAFTDIL